MSRRQQEIAVVAIGVCIFGAWWLVAMLMAPDQLPPLPRVDPRSF